MVYYYMGYGIVYYYMGYGILLYAYAPFKVPSMGIMHNLLTPYGYR